MVIPVDHLENLGSQKTTYVTERPNSGILETFKSPFKMDQGATVDITFPEFSSLCPKTGQPDFASIVIEYCPRELCVESKSLKLYFFAWRQEGCFMEEITERIKNDLVEVLNPWWLRVQGQFNPRGATTLWPHVVWYHPEWEFKT